MTTNTRASAAICSAVTLTTNVSLNMVLSIQSGQALGAQTLTVRFAFAGGYVERFGPIQSLAANLPAGPWGCNSHGAPPAADLQVLAHVAAPRECSRGCEGFTATHKVM
jgi:hypothetical protein